MVNRRRFIQVSLSGAIAAGVSWKDFMREAYGVTQGPGLSDPALQPKFMEPVPNALDPGFIYDAGVPNKIKVAVGQSIQQTGLVDALGNRLNTTVWGYGDQMFYTWPGRTFEARSNVPLEVKWENRLIDAFGMPLPPFITGKDNTSLGFGDYTNRSVIDESLHWAYSLPGYELNTIAADGIPIVPHVHGGHSDFLYDGNPEFFFSSFIKFSIIFFHDFKCFCQSRDFIELPTNFLDH